MSERRWVVNIVGQGEEDPRTLLPHPMNPKVHPPEQDAVVRASLEQFGWLKRVLKNRVTGHILDGHERIRLAMEEGEATVPVDYCEVAPEQEGAVLLTLDQSAALAQTHVARWAALRAQAEAAVEAPALLELWAQCAAGQAEREEPDTRTARWKATDDVAACTDAVRGRWEVARGESWALGPHRLVCGDCREASVVAQLMQGERAQAVVTDPIYGTARPGVSQDGEDPAAVARSAARVVPVDEGLGAVFQSPRLLMGWLAALPDAGWTFERLLWMYKDAQTAYPWRGWLLKSEAIILASKGAPVWQDVHPYAHDCYDVHEVRGELDEDIGWHGSVKPLSVVADLVQRLCPPGGVVFDGFLGSGTTLLACEQTGRVCRAIEIEPDCVAVTLERYARATGMRPRRVVGA
jgi:hypothetical protein